MLNLNYKESMLMYFLSKFSGKIIGRKRIQKQFFLLNKKFGQPIPFQYKIHYYGPFSRDLHETLTTTVDSGLVNQEISDYQGKPLYKYQLTSEGKIVAYLCKNKLPDNIKEKIDEMIEYTRYKSTDSIVNEVYELAGIKK